MKARLFVIGLFLFTFVACAKKAQVPEPVEGPSPELSAIDSLLWHHPDSALMCLIPYFDTCCREAGFCVSTTTAFNRHYAHLLLAELLYKNDYPQTYRTELLQAVAYFDSIAQVPEPAVAEHSRSIEGPSKEQIIFLDARAHYINGVGYYEQDSLVQACAEYLKTLEIMESHFEEKELIGHKARFMAYTYNRLGDMFSEQFMMEPAIDCYENALVFCRIEPTSPQGVSNILSRIGLQYDKLGDKEKMGDYYSQALVAMPNPDNLSYRDLSAGIALNDYQLGYGIKQSLEILRQIVVKAEDEGERLTRYLTIGAIFTEEGMYDSAVFYLEPVWENEKDVVSQIQAAECLRIIYDSIGDNEKLYQCLHFLALQKKTESQNKALVSQLEELFKTYMEQKLEQKSEKERQKSIKKTIEIILPIAIVVALAILIIAKIKGRNLLKKQQAEANRKLEETGIIHKAAMAQQEDEAKKALEEAEKQHLQEISQQKKKTLEIERTHRIQQSALAGRLKRSNAELRELKDQIKRQEELNSKPKQVESFIDEPICCLILERVNEGQFKSQMDCTLYKDNALNKEQMMALREATDRHFSQFTVRLKKAYPELTHGDFDYCCLYMLGLSDADISALMQKAYPTVSQRSRKIKTILGSEVPLSITLSGIAKDELYN